MNKAIQLTNIEFWSLIVALIALVISLAAIAVGLFWSAFQKSLELKSLRSTQYHQIASWISDGSQHSRQIAAVLDMANYPEFKDASVFLLLQIRNDIVGVGAGRLQAAIDKTVADLTGKKA
jgi:Tfp pilus assembly protein PilO